MAGTTAALRDLERRPPLRMRDRAVDVLALLQRERPRAAAGALHARLLRDAGAREPEAVGLRVVLDDDGVLPVRQRPDGLAVEAQRDEHVPDRPLEHLAAGHAARHE